jgi:hypothetical protein
VRVLKLAVHDHPLFCPEDRLALLLRQAHSAYVTELERDPCRYLALRLAAAVHELQKLAPHASPQFSGRDQGRRRGSNDEGNNNFYDSEGDANNKDASAPEEDPALAKLIALAYPNAGLYAGPNNFGLDHLSSSGDNSVRKRSSSSSSNSCSAGSTHGGTEAPAKARRAAAAAAAAARAAGANSSI